MPASSARNRIRGIVRAVIPEGALARIELDCGFPLIALVTAQSAAELRLAAGDTVCAVVKTTGRDGAKEALIDGTFTLPPKGTHRGSAPTPVTEVSIATRSDAIVTSRTGSASSPPLISRPVAPTEKSPEIGFTPE